MAVHAIELLMDARDSAEIFDLDQDYPPFLARACSKRRRQYLAGRKCAREAMQRLGYAAMAIGRDDEGRPCWPAGLTGSITHSDRIVAAAVARNGEVEALGIDCERLLDSRVANEIAEMIARQTEIDGLNALGLDRETAISLIFSAKEALYKCLNPLVRRFFDHQAAELVDVDRNTDQFLIRLGIDLGPRFCAGRTFVGDFAMHAGHIHTAIILMRNTRDWS